MNDNDNTGEEPSTRLLPYRAETWNRDLDAEPIQTPTTERLPR